jgi:hypothetical protein
VDKLPVTTDVACAAGREIWGYPKWVTPIEWHRNGRTLRGDVGHEVVVEVGTSWAPALPLPLSFTTFTVLDGRLVRTRVRAHGRVQLVPGSRASVQVLATGRLGERIENFHSELPEACKRHGSTPRVSGIRVLSL